MSREKIASSSLTAGKRYVFCHFFSTMTVCKTGMGFEHASLTEPEVLRFSNIVRTLSKQARLCSAGGAVSTTGLGRGRSNSGWVTARARPRFSPRRPSEFSGPTLALGS